MSRRHERTLGFSTCCFIVVMVASLRAVLAETCDELNCLNSNPCQASVAPGNNSTTHARCVCGGKWAGRRCQHLIRLEPAAVTSSEVTLKVDLMTSHSYHVAMSSASRGSSSALSLVAPVEEEGEGGGGGGGTLNYTLVFWRRNDTITSLTSSSSSSSSSSASSPSSSSSSFLTSGDISCVLLHKTNSRQPTLYGLLPRTRYTICVENGFIDSCILASFSDASSAVPFPPSTHATSFQPSAAAGLASSSSSSWPSNCVTIFTPPRPETVSSGGGVMTDSSTVTAVAIVSVLVLVVLVVVFVVFLVRRQSVSVRLFVDAVCCGWCCCSFCSSTPSSSSSSSSSCCCYCCSDVVSMAPDSLCNNSDSLDTARLRLSSSGSSLTNHNAPRTVFLEEGDSLSRRQQQQHQKKHRGEEEEKKRSSARAVWERLRGKKRQKSSSYTTADMLLPPPPPSLLAPFNENCEEALALALDRDILDDDSVFENEPERRLEPAALPAIHRGGGKKPRGHRGAKGKRRGYVAYSTKKDKNIRLTTVLESPLDDDEEDDVFDDVLMADDGAEGSDDFNTI